MTASPLVATNTVTMTDAVGNNGLGGTLRLWQLISPTLPVGAYAYSAGLEYAVASGWISDEAGLERWAGGQIRHALAGVDAPVLTRLYRAWEANDRDAVLHWTRELLASRETAELRAEDRHMARAMARVLAELGESDARDWDRPEDTSWAALYSLAAVRWGVSLEEAVAGYLWAWLENQVAAGVKLIPLGQSAGQRVLYRVAEQIPAAVAYGIDCPDEAIGAGAPGVALASAAHETQYTRLFRS